MVSTVFAPPQLGAAGDAGAGMQPPAPTAPGGLEASGPAAGGPAAAPTIEWENTEGAPEVTITQPAAEYFSEDIGTSPGTSVFNPTFGCKCGDWRAAPTHPSITFKDDFLAGHPDFLKNLAQLQVRMEDTTAKQVHWDATYDMLRFPSAARRRDGKYGLSEMMPAIAGSGKNLRFMTFCPPEGAAPHSYELTVTALDHTGNPMEYFNQSKTVLSATVPPPKPEPEQPQQGPGPGSAPAPPGAGAQAQQAQQAAMR